MIKNLREVITDDMEMDVKTSDMLVRSELVCATIRSAITNMAGSHGGNNVIYRNTDDTIPMPMLANDLQTKKIYTVTTPCVIDNVGADE